MPHSPYRTTVFIWSSLHERNFISTGDSLRILCLWMDMDNAFNWIPVDFWIILVTILDIIYKTSFNSSYIHSIPTIVLSASLLEEKNQLTNRKCNLIMNLIFTFKYAQMINLAIGIFRRKHIWIIVSSTVIKSSNSYCGYRRCCMRCNFYFRNVWSNVNSILSPNKIVYILQMTAVTEVYIHYRHITQFTCSWNDDLKTV